MPLAAHAKDNGGDSQYSHDDTGCKEIAIPVAAALHGSLGIHDESRISRSLAVSSSLTRDRSLFPRSELPREEAKLQTTGRAKYNAVTEERLPQTL